MKILMTTMGLGIGGAETHIVELTRELCRQGHQVILASNGGVYEETLKAMGVSHVKVPMHQRNLGDMLTSLRLLKKLIETEQPDLVHAHARIPGFLCGILQRKLHFPFITSAHWVFAVNPLLRLMTNWGQATVAVSQDIKDYLMHNYQVPEDQISVTINGIDTDTFAPGEKDLALQKKLGLGPGPIIGTVSRLDAGREKAARDLIALMPELRKAFPTAQLLVVGGGDMEATLYQDARQVNETIGDTAVIMTGARTDIAPLVSLSDVFVGVSRSALEAMAAGKPTILAGNEGYMGLFREALLEDARASNFCCRGFAPCTQKRLLEDLTLLLSSSAPELAELGAFGRQVVMEDYSVTRMAQDYLSAYDRLLHPPKVLRGTISGYYGYGNLGDDAILQAISRQLYDPQHPVRLTVLSRHPKDTAREYGLPAVQRFWPVAVYRTLKKSDVLISGGGSLLQDKTSTRSLLYYLAVIRLANRMKKPVFLYANGIGPLNNASSRRRVLKCLEDCCKITLRDEKSLDELRSIGLSRQDIEITGDPVFTLMPEHGSEADLAAYGIPADGEIIGVSVRALPAQAHYAGQFAALCDRLVNEAGKTIVFLVMQESEDEAISQRIQNLMNAPSYLVKTPGNPEKMLGIIAHMELLISMRFHTLVFAANVNVPMIGCIYDPKVEAMLQMLKMPSCGTPDTIDAEEAYRIVQAMEAELSTQKETLAEQVHHIRAKAWKNEEIFRQTFRDIS